MNMPGSKYERELRFIQTETRRLGNQLSKLREMMPVDPIEAARKADEVLGIEAEIGRLLQRKKEIEESFIAAGMEVPSMDKDMNENVHQDSRPFVGDEDESSPAPQIKPEGTVEELTEEIESVTDELMGIEIKMLRADMNGDEDEKIVKRVRDYASAQAKCGKNVVVVLNNIDRACSLSMDGLILRSPAREIPGWTTTTRWRTSASAWGTPSPKP